MMLDMQPLPHCGGPHQQRDRSLGRIGLQLCSGARPSSGASLGRSSGYSRPNSRASSGGCSIPPLNLDPPPPPSGRRGIMHSESAPTLTPKGAPATNVPGIIKARTRRPGSLPESLPKSVWTDSVSHYGDTPWPTHAVPLIAFTGSDRPRPSYKEEVKFSLRDDRYVNFAIRLRSGVGDKSAGGSVGLIHTPSGNEVEVGDKGQLVTISEVVIQQDGSVIISVIGDKNFRVSKSWMPRGMRGLQMAFIDVANDVSHVETIIMACRDDAELAVFARAVDSVPPLAKILSSTGPFTVFVPLAAVFERNNGAIEELVEDVGLLSLLQCHICPGRIPCEALYSGRVLTALDGTRLHIKFGRWPRGLPSVNDAPIEHMDVACANGIIHVISGLLVPMPVPTRRPYALAGG